MGGRGAVFRGGLLGEILGIAKEDGERTAPSAGDAAGTNAARKEETGVALGR